MVNRHKEVWYEEGKKQWNAYNATDEIRWKFRERTIRAQRQSLELLRNISGDKPAPWDEGTMAVREGFLDATED